MNKIAKIVAILAIVLSAAVAMGASGAFTRYMAAPGTIPTANDLNRLAAWAEHANHVMLLLFAQGNSFCVGVTPAAGTGFNVNVDASANGGVCVFYDTAGTATAPQSLLRVLEFAPSSHNVATTWAANPGANTYYFHCGVGASTYTAATQTVTETPDCIVSLNASEAGYVTIGSAIVAGAEPSAATYTYATTFSRPVDRLTAGGVIADALTADADQDDDVLVDHSAMPSGNLLFVDYAGGLTNLCGFNADNAATDADSYFSTDDGLFVFVDDNDAGGAGATHGVQVYLDEDAVDGERILAVLPTTADCWVPTSNGSLIRIVYSATAAADGVAVYFNDFALTPADDRLQFTSPTAANATNALAPNRALAPAVVLP